MIVPSNYAVSVRIKWLSTNWLPNEINTFIHFIFSHIYFLQGALFFFESSILCALSWGETRYVRKTLPFCECKKMRLPLEFYCLKHELWTIELDIDSYSIKYLFYNGAILPQWLNSVKYLWRSWDFLGMRK